MTKVSILKEKLPYLDQARVQYEEVSTIGNLVTVEIEPTPANMLGLMLAGQFRGVDITIKNFRQSNALV